MNNEILLKVLSRSYSDALTQAFRNEGSSADELEQIQKKKLVKLLEHCHTNVSYYTNLFTEHSIQGIEDFHKIPFLTKDAIRKHKDKLCASNISGERFRHNSTSGSTGLAMKFFSDSRTDFVRHACAHRGDSWTGWQFGEKIIIIWGAPSDTSKARTLKGKLVNSAFLFNTTTLSSFNMSDADILKYVEVINRARPTLIVGYPSSLEAFARYVLSNTIKVHPPKGIITGGETLHEYQRQIIQQAFDTKVLNRYGCREVGHIANECELQNGLHISSDHVIIEVINKKGEPCKPGEIGEIVVTDLDNYVFPFIRYKIGDMGVMSNKICPCGRSFPLLQSVEGRTFDLIVGVNGNRVPGNYFTLLRYDLPSIEQFQIVQRAHNSLELKIKVNAEFNDLEKGRVVSLFREKLGHDMLIDITIVDEFETTDAGKFRWVISKIGT